MARYRTLQEWEALTGEDALTAPERALIEACQSGEDCVLGDGTRPEGPDPARTVRADLLRGLIVGRDIGAGVVDYGIAIQGAHVVGRLDLSFSQVTGAPIFWSGSVAQIP